MILSLLLVVIVTFFRVNELSFGWCVDDFLWARLTLSIGNDCPKRNICQDPLHFFENILTGCERCWEHKISSSFLFTDPKCRCGITCDFGLDVWLRHVILFSRFHSSYSFLHIVQIGVTMCYVTKFVLTLKLNCCASEQLFKLVIG